MLNTLYITTQGVYLSREGETLVVKVDREIRLRVPIHTLDGIVCFGRVTMSPFLMDLCARNKVAVSFLTERGRFLARVQGPVSGNVLLRREQYRLADDLDHSADIARSIVIVKIANSRTVIRRTQRRNVSPTVIEVLNKAADRLSRIQERLLFDLPLDSIRGLEGEAAQVYFSVFDPMIVAEGEDFRFTERSRRPPLDNVNALLSFLYTLLVHDVSSALESVGLDPAVGYLHRDRPGRPSLALDMMEEFRPVLADRLVLSLINRRQVKAGGFKKTETGAVMMDDKTRKTVLETYQKRKQEEIMHPFIKEKVQIGRLPHIQALLMAKRLRGELDAYPPFIWK